VEREVARHPLDDRQRAQSEMGRGDDLHELRSACGVPTAHSRRGKAVEEMVKRPNVPRAGAEA
jgi:hypothetical protein